MTEHQYFTGQFVWRELMTKDAERAKGFYGELCNWTFEAMPMPDGEPYTFVKLGDQPIGGLHAMGPEMAEVPAHWASFVSVEDVDATYERALGAGALSVQTPQRRGDPDRRSGVTGPSGITWWIATHEGA